MCGVQGHFYQGREQRPTVKSTVEAGRRPWPRGGRRDLEAAVAGAGDFDAQQALAALDRARPAIVEAVAGVLETRLELDPDEALRLVGPAAAPSPPSLEAGPERAAWAEPDPPLIWIGRWSDLVDAPLAEFFEAFEAARPVVWLGDEQLPEVPAAMVRALHEAGLPAGALGLVQAVEPNLRRELLEAGGDRPRRPAAWLHLGLEDDLEAAAVHCVAAAFGAAPALGGRRDGSLKYVTCHPRRLAAFTEALLAEVDAEGQLLRALDRGARAELASEVERALDEGGTPIRGCDGRWTPGVVTNWEPGAHPRRRGRSHPRTVEGLPLLRLGRATQPSPPG
ncbi:MAG: hypothetical protein AAFZ65_16385 [Planctomycetota bacterium]